MPGTRNRRGTASRTAPYGMTNINNWYSEQFWTKLAERNIKAAAYYTKAELKSLYEGHSESSNNCLIIQLILIVKQKETCLT